ncbi:hypothetical protein FRC07_013732 [Ceratobasidium sp. 392]|nr:hypothetical protein FRC07_013732 [Ceratobasidium sp. 392]
MKRPRNTRKPTATSQANAVADATKQLSPNLETLAVNHEAGKNLPAATGKQGRSSAQRSPPKSPGLLTIPFEVFAHIISNAQPGGLLALARTCKTMRNILMRKSMANMWEAAEQKTHKLPARPKGMSSPQYAALAFFNECSLCGEDRDIKLYAKLRVRLCESCSASELIDISNIENDADMPLDAQLSVIFKSPTSSSKQGGDADEEPNNKSPHCLRRDLLTHRVKQRRFLQSRNLKGLDIWEHEQHQLVHAHEEFAEMLVRFLAHPRLTPLQMVKLAGSDRLAGVEPEIDYKYFNNGDDLRFLREANDHSSLTSFTYEQCLCMHKAFHEMKYFFHPYRDVLRALGAGTDIFTILMGLASPSSNPFEDYPYPNAATILSWPLCSDLQNIEPSDIITLITREPQETLRYVHNWREEGERELVGWWKSDVDSSDDELTDPIVKVKESTSTTEKLPADLRLLLRADTILSSQKPGCPGYQGVMLYYPFYYKNPTSCIYPQAPSGMNSTRIYRHLEAEKVAKALLRDLGMPDIAYSELCMLGASFACGRCQDCEPKKWNGMVNHYREQVQLWHKLQSQNPQFKTSLSIVFRDVHDLGSSSASRPLVRRLTKQEAVDASNLYSSLCAQTNY